MKYKYEFIIKLKIIKCNKRLFDYIFFNINFLILILYLYFYYLFKLNYEFLFKIITIIGQFREKLKY